MKEDRSFFHPLVVPVQAEKRQAPIRFTAKEDSVLMGSREEVSDVNQPSGQASLTPRPMLLVSSGALRRCRPKESIMVKLMRRIMKWGLSAAKVSLAASVVLGSAGLSEADEFDGFYGLDFGSIVQPGLERSSRIWLSVDRPLKESAPPTTGAYRATTQPVYKPGHLLFTHRDVGIRLVAHTLLVRPLDRMSR